VLLSEKVYDQDFEEEAKKTWDVAKRIEIIFNGSDDEMGTRIKNTN